MGNLTSSVPAIVGTIGSALGVPVVGQIASLAGASISETARRQELRASQDLALAQLQQQQNTQLSQQQQDAALEREKIALQARTDEQERRAALRRAVARQRVNFAASGVGASGGSSEAVLLGLFDENEEDLAQRQKLDHLRSAALDQNIAQSASLNVLQRTQLAQRQDLQRAMLKF